MCMELHGVAMINASLRLMSRWSIVEDFQASATMRTCTMVRQQSRHMHNIFKLVNRSWNRSMYVRGGWRWQVSKGKDIFIKDGIA